VAKTCAKREIKVGTCKLQHYFSTPANKSCHILFKKKKKKKREREREKKLSHLDKSLLQRGVVRVDQLIQVKKKYE
jgi:hypothetical protein